MNKQAISVTLESDNLIWLRGRAVAAGRVSVSEMLDRLIREARADASGVAGGRSIVGTLLIAADDPDLKRADDAVRMLFTRSLARALPRGRPAPARRGSRRPRG
jgi:hypothetical protein